MSIHLLFNRERLTYSTFDTVSGIVAVRVTTPTTVAAISVKLEGEATSTLGPQTGDRKRDKKHTEAEVHKVLYHVQLVFPSADVLRHATPGTVWTISPGRYEFPFSFKIPYETDCIRNTRGHPNNLGDMLLDSNRDLYNNVHIRSQLPPSLDGPVNMANIIYFVKATLVRPQFYKENYRALTRITFVPSEPPRPESSKEETYARRQYSFGTTLKRNPSLLPRFMKKNDPVVDFSGDQPSFCVDARLPNPPILTCNRPIPLRIVFKKLNDSNAPVYLHSMDIDILGYTNIRARHLHRTETTAWSIGARPFAERLIASGDVTAGTEWELDSSYWNQSPLPDSIAPSFTTCNLSRAYELQVRLHFANGPLGSRNVQMATLPLKLQCEIFSGIVPPPHVIAANMPPTPMRPVPITPHPVPPPGPPPRPPRPAAPPSAPQPQTEDDAPPPTYEDAVADSLRENGAAQAAQGTVQGAEAPTRSVSARKPVPPPLNTNNTYSTAGPSSAPPPSDNSTSRASYPSQDFPAAAPPPGPPPGRTERNEAMPTGGTATQPSLLDDSPDLHPQIMTPQATGNNPFAEYLTDDQQQSHPYPQTYRTSAQSSLLETSPIYRSPTVNSTVGGTNSPRSNNPFAQYLNQDTNQPSQNHPFARDVSAQIDEDQRLAERLQQMELGDQEGGVISSGHGGQGIPPPNLPPRPGSMPPQFTQNSSAGPSQPLSPATTGPAQFGPPIGLPPRPPNTYPYQAPQSPYPNHPNNQ